MDRVLEISRLTDGAGVKLTGELDLHYARQVTTALAEFQRAGDVRVDMADVTFIDSSGLKALLAFARSRNGNGKLLLVEPTDGARRLFEIIRLEEHPGIEVHPAEMNGHSDTSV